MCIVFFENMWPAHCTECSDTALDLHLISLESTFVASACAPLHLKLVVRFGSVLKGLSATGEGGQGTIRPATLSAKSAVFTDASTAPSCRGLEG